MYAAVLSYFSIAFLGVSGLPAFLMEQVETEDPGGTRDELSQRMALRLAVFQFSHGLCVFFVAGWAGKLSDHFGRRRCAALPALGQALGMTVLAFAAYTRVHWAWSLAGWTITGLLGGPYVFLSAAFAYIADFTSVRGRGKAFSWLDSLILYVACIGPLFGGELVSHLGFVGLWGLSALMFAISAALFATAPPSPQVLAPPPQCSEWLTSFTPVLLFRFMTAANCRLGALTVAFLLATGGVQGGVQAFILYAQRYLDWKEEQIGFFVAPFSALGATMILLVHPVATCLLRRPPSDLSMVRAAYFAPLVYFSLLAIFPSQAEPIAYGALPLLTAGACALPHFRALFSAARPPEHQGEQMALVAALETLPQLFATPLVSVAFSALIHTPSLVFVICGAILAVVILLLFCLRESTLIGPSREGQCNGGLREPLSAAQPVPPGERTTDVCTSSASRGSSEWLSHGRITSVNDGEGNSVRPNYPDILSSGLSAPARTTEDAAVGSDLNAD